MDFLGIIKGAWRVTWRHKTLWVLGLFAGSSGGGYANWSTPGYRVGIQDTGRWGTPNAAWSELSAFVHDWAPALVAGAVALALIGLLWLALSLAAQAGLVWEVDAAERGGTVSASEGWNVGFHHWWKVLAVGVVLTLPIVLFVLLVLAAGAAILLPLIRGVSSAGIDSAAGWAGIAWLVALLIASAPLFIVLGFVLGTMYLLAVRYLVIEGRSPIDAIRGSWQALRHRFKDVFLMWLVTIGLGIGFGIAIAVPAAAVAAGITVTVLLGAWPVAAVLGLGLFAAVMVVGAAWNTYTSALWTIFFRKLTGRDAGQGLVATPVGSSYAPAPPPAYGSAGCPPPGGYPSGDESAPPAGHAPPAGPAGEAPGGSAVPEVR